ncbi:DUF1178 family protein [Qipengyuania sediminis]|uniref:DUF1178 family protein n=1 Tax=Qipengyuania sediminis TaxID=1532023 RepID=UPI001059A491|nr:DUF1178 family protein [Qipengyuania sediminis]
MIVFQLSCGNAHSFEGWFASSDDYADQQARGLLACPVCENAAVTKAPMAPAVPAKANRTSADGRAALANRSWPPEVREAVQALAMAQAKALERSEWVGDRFAEDVRSMHYGEIEEKQVHGRASRDDALALLKEGIAVAPLLIPVAPPEELN